MYSIERSAKARDIMLSELPDCVNRGLLAAWFARHDAEGALMTVEDCNIVAAAYNAKRAEAGLPPSRDKFFWESAYKTKHKVRAE